MAKKYSGKTRRFGTVAVLLTVLTVVTVILLNGIVTKLALRYGWYIRMTPQLTFPVTDACYDYLDRYVMDSVSAEEAGMTKPSGSQVFYLDLSEGDSAVVFQQQEPGVLDKLLDSLNHGVYAAVEYFS